MLTASNAVPSTEIYFVTIDVIPVITELTIERKPDAYIILKPRDDMYFHIVIGGFTEQTCVVLDKDVSSEKDKELMVYGSDLSCMEHTDVVPMGGASSDFNIVIQYRNTGTYTMSVTVSDLIQSITKHITIIISVKRCKNPILDIIKQHREFKKPMSLAKSAAIDITGVCEIQCEDTLYNVKEWKVYTIDEGSGYDIEEISLGRK